MIGQHTVDLFRHLTVKTTKPRLDMRNGNVQLGCYQRARQRRIRIAIYKHPIRLFLLKDRLHADEHFTRLHGMTSRTNL